MQITWSRSPRRVGRRDEGRWSVKVERYKCSAAHQALDAENGHHWLPRRTQEVTRRAYMALEASAAADGGGLLRCNSGQDGRTETFVGCVRLDTATK